MSSYLFLQSVWFLCQNRFCRSLQSHSNTHCDKYCCALFLLLLCLFVNLQDICLCVILIICLRYSNLCRSFYCFWCFFHSIRTNQTKLKANKTPDCRFCIDTFCAVFIQCLFLLLWMFHILCWAEASHCELMFLTETAWNHLSLH